MDENPYRSPNTQPEPPPLLGRRRRMASTAALTFGVCGSLSFLLGIYRSFVVLTSDSYFLTDQLNSLLIWIAVLCALGPGLVLLGFAIRKILRWRQFAIALTCLTAAMAIYLVWWWNQLRAFPWPT